MMISRASALAAALLVVATAAAAAQPAAPPKPGGYPDRPVTVIVAFGAGGGTDRAARTVFRTAERLAGTPFPVVNRPGASGEIGWTAIAQAQPDG
jgi:tripartite-type tricarboxylate transporter receptor subunit TctC